MSGPLKQLEYSIIRYVPNVVKEEFVNIGIIMLESAAKNGFADIQLVRDWRRVRHFDPNADLEWIQAMERDLRVQLLGASDRFMFMNKLYESFSGQVQLSRLTTFQSEEPAVEFARLVDLYLKAPVIPAESTPLTGRNLIRHKMGEAFDALGEDVRRNLPVSEYTQPNDPFKFDFGYWTSFKELKLFQAVSLQSGAMAAMLLASRFPAIAVAMKMKISDVPMLTAVINENPDRSKNNVVFALESMQDAGITIAPVSEMPRIAERARREIRLN